MGSSIYSFIYGRVWRADGTNRGWKVTYQFYYFCNYKVIMQLNIGAYIYISFWCCNDGLSCTCFSVWFFICLQVLLLTSGCAGKTLEPKEMKALTTVLDESRAALKAVKSVVNQIQSLAFRHPNSTTTTWYWFPLLVSGNLSVAQPSHRECNIYIIK